MKTLAIETSCDDTSIGIVNFDGNMFELEKMLSYSQVSKHQEYGGVVPELASRLHADQIIKVYKSLDITNMDDIDFISVTTHPGLPGSLVIGKTVASILGEFFDKEVVEVNHIHGHIFSIFIERNYKDIKLPLVLLTASGGHNDIYLIDIVKHKNLTEYSALGKYHIYRLGMSRDDASGEAYDKVSKMIGGPYPGGPRIDQTSDNNKKIDPNVLDILPLIGTGKLFKRIWLEEGTLDFSFSGVKAQVSNLLKKLEKNQIVLTNDLVSIIAYEFRETVVEVLSKKLIQAGQKFGAQTLGICGGVSASARLLSRIEEDKQDIEYDIPLYRPTKIVYSTDNSAMIGVAGIIKKNGA